MRITIRNESINPRSLLSAKHLKNLAGVLALLACAGCAGPGGRDAAMVEYTPMADALTLSQHVGQKIEIDGLASDMPWQHLIQEIEGFPHANYVDIGRGQVVVYSTQPFRERRKLRIRGSVVKAEGTSKRPGSDQPYVEYQIVADSWETLE